MPDSNAAGSYGPSEDASPDHGASFSVPYLVIDDKGRVTVASTKQITLPSASSATSVSWSNVTDKPTSFPPSSHSSQTTEYGASSESNYGHSIASSTVPLAPGTPSAGTETSAFARGDHVHPAQTTISGNAGSATVLETPRNISLTGDASGSTTFDGSADVSISVSTIKEVAYVSTEPSASNTSSLDNESVIFYADGSSVGNSNTLQPVYTSGNQTIDGIKTFASGIFKNAVTLDSSTSVIDATISSGFVKTITGTTTFSFASIPSGVFCSVMVMLVNGGDYVVSWPQSVKWSRNETPDLTPGGIDVLMFTTFNGGTTWFGNIFCSNSSL